MYKHIEVALKTWYDKKHPLHLDLEPSLMGLAGECGELVDLHKKAKFKPGFELTREMELDELGDIWYYLRIVAYQTELIGDLDTHELSWSYTDDVLPVSMSIELYKQSGLLLDWLVSAYKDTNELREFFTIFINILEKLNCTLDKLTELNWQKLSEREDKKIGYGFKHD